MSDPTKAGAREDPPPRKRERANGVLPKVVVWLLVGVGLAATAIVLFLAGRGSRLPAFTEAQVRDAVSATIQSEARQSFLVTGRLDVVATASIENNRIFLPNLLDLNVGTARSTVRAPGRVFYGFDVRRVTADMIRLVDDSTISVQLPPLQVLAVEPRLERMEIETDVSWSRSSEIGREVERRAIVHAQAALRQQGVRHLRESTQPRMNTAEALATMLRPAVQALGIERPGFLFDLDDGIQVRRPAPLD